MAKTFNEVFEEIKSNISISKKGNPVKSFSRQDFAKLAKALINPPDYTINAVALRNGEVTTTEVKPIEAFRGVIRRILVDFGVDKQEADRVLESAYEIKSVDGFYELTSELIYQYINAGKKFDFITREDFVGSFSLKSVNETTTIHKIIQNPDEIHTVNKKAHKQLDKRSKCPKWLKTRLK